MNNNNGQIRLVMKKTLRLWEDTHFICKIPFLKKIGIQLSRRLKNNMPEICLNIQIVDYQLGEALVLINVYVGF